MLFVRIRGATVRVEKKLALFASFLLKMLPQLNIEAVNNLKTKSSGINPHTMGYIFANFRISAVFGF